MPFRPRSLALLASASLTLVALGGVEHSASASPASDPSAAVGGAISGDVTGGEVTITPITQADFEKSQASSSCVTQAAMTLCQQALLEKGGGNTWERVDYSATAYVGQVSALRAQAEVTLNEGYHLTSTGDTSTNTSPYVRIEWKNTPNPLRPYNGPDIDIPAEPSGMNFAMIVGSPGSNPIAGFCGSDPEHDMAWQLDCSA